MTRSLKAILRANPRLRAVARAGVAWAENAKARVLGTRLHERRWRNRHLVGGSDWDSGDDWIASYWKSRAHSHRPYLIDRVAEYAPTSVFEFGCNCGPNLSLLRRANPQLQLTGVDINRAAIRAGEELLAAEGGRPIELVEGGIGALADYPDRHFDVFLTDAVLLYVGSDRIDALLSQAVRLARRGVVMLEWHHSSIPGSRMSRDMLVRGRWVRDYRDWLERIVDPTRIRISRLPSGLWPGEEWSRFGHVIEVDLRT